VEAARSEGRGWFRADIRTNIRNAADADCPTVGFRIHVPDDADDVGDPSIAVAADGP